MRHCPDERLRRTEAPAISGDGRADPAQSQIESRLLIPPLAVVPPFEGLGVGERGHAALSPMAVKRLALSSMEVWGTLTME